MIKITLTCGSETLQRTFFQQRVVLGPESDPTVDFPLPSGEALSIIEREQGFYLIDQTGEESPLRSGQTLDLSGWQLHFEGVLETSEFYEEEREPSDAEIAAWLEEVAPKKRPFNPLQGRAKWQLPTLCTLLLLLTLFVCFKVGAAQERNRTATTLTEIAALLHEATPLEVAPSSPPTQFVRLVEQGLPKEQAAALKQELAKAHYTLKFYTSKKEEKRFLLVAAPTGGSLSRIFFKRPTLIMSSDEAVVRQSCRFNRWRDLLGSSLFLDTVNREELEKLIQTSKISLEVKSQE